MASEEHSSEDRLIARHFKPLATHPAALGLADDAALLSPPAGCELVLKTDAIIGRIHFFPDDPPGSIARKALRVNLSDLAAKGAAPLGFLLTLGLPKQIDDSWLAAFAEALGQDAEKFGCPLFGGDTVRSPDVVVVSVSVIGAVPQGTMLRRSGAVEGHRVVVTGTIGDAALGLRMREDASAGTRWRLDRAGRMHLESRYLVPEPRNVLADLLRRHASAAMDVSDGLVGDLAKLCRASRVSAEVMVERVPLSLAAHAALAAEPALLDAILTGGDDYEVLATVPESRVADLQEAARALNVVVTDIGHIVGGEREPRFVHNGHTLIFDHRSFSHF